jgi:(p)ppGpp synthase/HD superfamily hydrolase
MTLSGDDATGSDPRRPLFSPRLEAALRLAARAHRDQCRKATDIPYIQHPLAVAWILDRLGFDEEVVTAGLLHDVVEDTSFTLPEISHRFGNRVAAIVDDCTERKHTPTGEPIPWAERKAAHLARAATASVEARAVMLADKLHNLLSIEADLAAGHEVWSRFNADRAASLANHRRFLQRLSHPHDDPRLARLVGEVAHVLKRIDPEGAGPASR